MPHEEKHGVAKKIKTKSVSVHCAPERRDGLQRIENVFFGRFRKFLLDQREENTRVVG